jgi:5-oxoprolinase (ATP-hydrolysing)
VADALGMESILIHPLSGLLSAYGIGLASVFASRQQALIKPLEEDSRTDVKLLIDVLCKGVFEELAEPGRPDDAISWRPMLQLRYDGTDTTIPVAFSDFDFAAARAEFEAAHKAQFGFVYDNKTVIIEAISVEGIDDREDHPDRARTRARPGEISDGETRPVYAAGKWHDARVIVRREGSSPGNRLKGPALIIEPNQTIVIEPGWEGRINARDHVVMTRFEKLERALAIGADQADPILLEVFNNLFMSIAEQMGVTLQNTAYSVNIKERLDFSCAVFDRTGALVANAPHMPVHLGSMDRSRGNHHPPQRRATSTPATSSRSTRPTTAAPTCPTSPWSRRCSPMTGQRDPVLGASRGHHADVGGTAPGSMTPLATTVDEEGVLIDNFRSSSAAASARPALRRASDRPSLPGPQRHPEHRRPEGPDRRQRTRRGGV